MNPTMTRTQWRVIKRLYGQLLDLPRKEHEAFLNRQSEQHRQQLQELMDAAAHGKSIGRVVARAIKALEREQG